jgi:hypothetical protein
MNCPTGSFGASRARKVRSGQDDAIPTQVIFPPPNPLVKGTGDLSVLPVCPWRVELFFPGVVPICLVCQSSDWIYRESGEKRRVRKVHDLTTPFFILTPQHYCKNRTQHDNNKDASWMGWDAKAVQLLPRSVRVCIIIVCNTPKWTNFLVAQYGFPCVMFRRLACLSKVLARSVCGQVQLGVQLCTIAKAHNETSGFQR